MAELSPYLPWRVAGTYVESCNCEAICPCRMIDGRPGGRSTYGICLSANSWLIEDARAGEVDLSGLAVVMASRYDDDEPGSPWSSIMYVDERGDQRQRHALTEIWRGRLGGSVGRNFPWVWKPSHLLAVRPVRIEVDHTPRRQWFRVRDFVSVRIAGPFGGDETVRCVIPGYDQPGEELYTEWLEVDDEPPLAFEFSGNCGYAAAFEYRSEDG